MHTVALASNGTVWTWGCNDEGALGRQGAENIPLQVDASLKSQISDISAGDSHTIAYNTSTNKIFYWGCYRVSSNTIRKIIKFHFVILRLFVYSTKQTDPNLPYLTIKNSKIRQPRLDKVLIWCLYSFILSFLSLTLILNL